MKMFIKIIVFPLCSFEYIVKTHHHSAVWHIQCVGAYTLKAYINSLSVWDANLDFLEHVGLILVLNIWQHIKKAMGPAQYLSITIRTNLRQTISFHWPSHFREQSFCFVVYLFLLGDAVPGSKHFSVDLQ